MYGSLATSLIDNLDKYLPSPLCIFSATSEKTSSDDNKKGFINLNALIVERVSTFQGGAVVFLEDVQANRALGHTWLLMERIYIFVYESDL